MAKAKKPSVRVVKNGSRKTSGIKQPTNKGLGSKTPKNL